MNKYVPSWALSWRFLLPLFVVAIAVPMLFPSVTSIATVAIILLIILVLFRGVLVRGIVSMLSPKSSNSFLFSEEYEKAVELADQQIAKNPKDVVAHLTRSTANIHLGKLDAARTDCNSALALDPKSVYTLNNRAVISMQENNLPAAMTDMQQALTLQPDNPVLLYGRGSVYARMGNDAAALTDFNEAIDIEPEQAVTYIARGLLAFERGDIADALADFQKADELAPETHQFEATLAVAEYVSGQIEAAQKRWQALPTRYTPYADPDWQGRVLNWPDAMVAAAAKLVAEIKTQVIA